MLQVDEVFVRELDEARYSSESLMRYSRFMHVLHELLTLLVCSCGNASILFSLEVLEKLEFKFEKFTTVTRLVANLSMT